MLLELVIDLADRIARTIVHERDIDRRLIDTYLRSAIVSSSIAHESSDISESLLVDEVVEFLHQGEYHRLGLDIRRIRELIDYRSAAESERVEICTFLSLELCLILLELISDILEKILAIAVVYEFL